MMDSDDIEKKVLKSGVGTEAKAGDDVEIHYTMRACGSGQLLDSSKKKSRPLLFTVGKEEVIAGLDWGVKGMRLGELALVHMPSTLAFGESGMRNGYVPPNQDVEVEIEMIRINDEVAADYDTSRGCIAS